VRGQLALITGASSGIGEACAEILAERGCDLILTGRRTDRIEELSSRLSEKFSIAVTPSIFDISDRRATVQAFDLLGDRLSKLSILVNNAGLAKGTDPLQSGDLEDWDAMIDTNVKGLLHVTRLCLPHFLKKNAGHIVNLGSVAGRWTYPGGGVYCATKFAVRALTEGLRLDLMGTPIRVTNIEPGMVETEFSLVRFKDEEKAKAVYKGLTPLSARDIAETIVWCLDRPKHVNIQELVIFPTDQAGVGPSYLHRR
jgi:3-hydroxy acid dehydrogenase / malonic semialdehyde reductase